MALEGGRAWSQFVETGFLKEIDVGGCQIRFIMLLGYGSLSFLLRVSLMRGYVIGFIMGGE